MSMAIVILPTPPGTGVMRDATSRTPWNATSPTRRVPLFFVGDDEYTIPKDVPVGAALEYLRVAKDRGQEVAVGALLTRVLGEEAYVALEQSRGLKQDQLDQIVSLVMDLSLGRAEQKGGKAAG